MLVLDTTSKTITVAMSGAAATTNPSFVTAYSDDNGTTFVEGSSDGILNGTTQVTMVAAPAASTRRLIKSLFIENNDTAPVTIIVTLNNSGTLRNIQKVTLAVGDNWSTDGVIDSNGNFKQLGASGYSGYSGFSGFSGISGFSGTNGASGFSGISGYSGYSGSGVSGYSGFSGISGYSGTIGSTTGSGAVVLQTTPSITTPVITGYTETAPSIANSSTAVTLSLSSGTVLSYTLTGNCTFTMPTATSGTSFIVKLIQDGTGSRTATFTGVKWPGGTAPTITTTATTGLDILSFVCINSVWYGTFAQAFA
ncbi:Collagen triple helix repeat [uncultured Caudovirales phage]|uniref:Collagen triple helix repeat n=1 Tax=uncultured Caudovirales phage TaxID=2100421 RepID=A0A6J5L0E2_9CAUD|nr:Collagen triple helix repeat [uncultured Caudovirales phage]CAB4133763.1 Collagen triple helix repeat [uncultured Caudovirales phage]